MPEEDLVDIKFRLYDGSDIGPFSYSSASTVDVLKQRVVSDWPKGLTSHFLISLWLLCLKVLIVSGFWFFFFMVVPEFSCLWKNQLS